MDTDPREEIWNLVREGKNEELLERAAVLHGHFCPGLAMGVKASLIALQQLNLEHDGMEDVLTIVETNSCFSDGVQYVTGCTFGNNALVYRDLGKTGATFVKRGEKGVRIMKKKDSRDNWENRFPEYSELFEKVVKYRKGTQEDRKKMMEIAKEISHFVVDLEPEKLFKIKEKDVTLPEYAPIHESYICEKCGESVMSTRTVKKEGKTFCLLCGEAEYFELDGHGMHIRGGDR